MCGTFDFLPSPTELAANAMMDIEKAHPDCSGTAVGVVVLEDGSVLVTTTIPMQGIGAPILCWAMGTSASEALCHSNKLPCVANALEAFTNPVVKYEEPDPNEPITSRYRSLASAAPQAKIELPPARCVKNDDDSVSFVLEVAQFVQSDEAVAAKGIPRCDYLNELGRSALACFVEGLRVAGVSLGAIFELDEEGQISSEGVVRFYDQLLPVLRVGENLLIGMPPAGADSHLFNFTFKFTYMPQTLPLMGLVHDVDPSVGEVAEKVEGDYFVYANLPLELTVGSDKMAETRVKLFDNESYLNSFDTISSKRSNVYASSELQNLGEDKLKAAMAVAVGSDAPGELHVANLYGLMLPNTAIGALVTVHDTPRAMHARKRAI